MPYYRRQFVFSLAVVLVPTVAPFITGDNDAAPKPFIGRSPTRRTTAAWMKEKKDSNGSSISYEETDASSKGLVSSLTGIVNFFSFNYKNDKNTLEKDSTLTADIITSSNDESASPPQTPEELMERIRDDYVVNNYLWTGKIDLTAFDRQCRFTDPTLSFQGTDQFTQNLDNLVPIVEALTEPGGCRSDLLDIDLNRDEGYVQSRWNMVGSLSALPWQPRIDVIGRTKFWYKPVDSIGANENDDDGTKPGTKGFQVYLYDEEWEIPAAKALLQLITPPGTIRNSNS